MSTTMWRHLQLLFLLFYALVNPGSCQDVLQDNATTSLDLDNVKRPSDSNTRIRLTDEVDRFFRFKKGGGRSIADLAARLKKEKEMEKQSNLMTADEASRTNLSRRNYSDISDYNSEQDYNKDNNPFKELWVQFSNDKHYVSEYNCNFDNDCKWTWRKDIANGFFITSGGKMKDGDIGPRQDANARQFGSYLILRLPLKSTEFHVTSPLIGPTTSSCKLNLFVYQENMQGGEIRIVGDKTTDTTKNSLNNHTQWLVNIIHGNDLRKWMKYDLSIGKITTNFTILLEVVPAENMTPGATVAFDNLQLYGCFAKNDDSCSSHQYKCKGAKECINATSVCDFNVDCPLGDDEKQNCHLMPYGSRCTFEEDWCGWTNDNANVLKWTRRNGSTPKNLTGPNFDHTYMNSTGNYLYVDMLKEEFASPAVLTSVVFNPPPNVHGNSSSKYFNTCSIRFYLHKTGKHKSGFLLQVTEITPTDNKTTKMYWSYMEDHGDQWIRQVFILPNITHRYFMHFEAKKGYRYLSDLAVDDISLSPECYGINIPEEELQGYNYWNPKLDVTPAKETVDDFKNKTYYKITTCNAKGRYGPSHSNCSRTYASSITNVTVLHDAGVSGVQKWIVPREGYYTFILAGAGGGKGSMGMGSSRGALVRTVLELKRGQEIFMLVGQEGTSACIKILGQTSNCSTIQTAKVPNKVRDILSYDINDTGGGGGGGTFVFMRNRTKDRIPIAVAAGGGGLGLSRFIDDNGHHGQEIQLSVRPYTGKMSELKSAGSGGGWMMYPGLVNSIHQAAMGGSLLMGGIGGKACYNSTDGRGDGGFGGGGGGCKNGGGGGGYAGGNANSTNGDGGISFVNPYRTEQGLSTSYVGHNVGSGYVVIIPGIEGCDCDYQCLALDEKRSEVTCVCPKTWRLAENKKSCIPIQIQMESQYPPWFVVVLIVTVFCLTVAFAVVCFVLYNRYQQQVSGLLRRKGCPVPDLQLSRLRQASGSMTAQYNPTYEFGGVITTITDLQHIPRDQLRLVKALGQGAFGEVYQGFYRQRPGDTVEMPVAVKTLQEMTTKPAEDDFITEALIMSKFDHPNIVHFIGVCFDKHPKFIILELLTGGDLKNFLRESRPKPDRPSPITMKDLLLIAIDVARGCSYLEEKRFIHRDIAARNCLLTTKGPGRVTKIADFGMSRDIYRADYYRKDGKAMLPVKWMPPEAFLEGIFSSKTDVWSFGILLWEIMKMGFMPYTGCTNREVMDLVIQGGRLDRPENCPGPIYGIMASCWHPQPEDRPSFSTIMERLGYCAQDPDVINAPLPMFYRAVSSERDTTVIRPSDSNENCLQVLPNASDYLVPNHTVPTTPDPIESTSSVEKLIPDSSNDHWETSFIMPNSKSTQPLLVDNNKDEENNQSVDKLLSLDNGATGTGHNNNFMVKNDSTSVKSGVSLDAGALAKSVMTPKQAKRYANIDENGVVQNGGYGIKYVSKSTGEINC